MLLASIMARRPTQVSTMRRQRVRVDFEQMEDAMHLASKGVKFARKCVQRAARVQKGQDNAHPSCRTKTRRSRNAPERIGPAPGYVPKGLPPVGEKWVHIGDGMFVTLRKYKQQLKEQQRREDQGWNS